MMTREQRLKEREVKRILHEEELARLEELKAKGEDPDARHSDRQLQSQLEKRQKELQELQSEEDPWVFDCSVCGMHGENIDDGTHSVACEKCNIWQHSKCMVSRRPTQSATTSTLSVLIASERRKTQRSLGYLL